ncbi:hypothetical protein CRG98_023497 [Punica granatum]|uniref:Uncharacterized protein n=1 Tax=Punica granatum TaxID=22663 RepID=A0A2I0JIL1_PUNGR|nr:hypothetical protein CRG98_023497 [Punica granatum]
MKATAGASNPNRGESANDSNWRVMAEVVVPLAGIRRISILRVLSIPWDRGLDSDNHSLIGVTGPLPPIRIASALCGIDSVLINEKFDFMLELLLNRKFVHF